MKPLYLQWNQKHGLVLEGDSSPTIAAKLQLEDKRHQIGIMAPNTYLQGVVNTFDLLPIEEFIAFYQRAVDAKILHAHFRFALMVADKVSGAILQVHVSRYLLDRRLVPIVPDDESSRPQIVSLGLERDAYMWHTPQEHAA